MNMPYSFSCCRCAICVGMISQGLRKYFVSRPPVPKRGGEGAPKAVDVGLNPLTSVCCGHCLYTANLPRLCMKKAESALRVSGMHNLLEYIPGLIFIF